MYVHYTSNAIRQVESKDWSGKHVVEVSAMFVYEAGTQSLLINAKNAYPESRFTVETNGCQLTCCTIILCCKAVYVFVECSCACLSSFVGVQSSQEHVIAPTLAPTAKRQPQKKENA